MNEYSVDNLLEKFYDTKQQISILENKLISLKNTADTIMDSRNLDTLKNDIYILQKKDMNRTSISKQDLPIDIWNKYSKESFYSAFYISKINEKKKRSPRMRSKKKKENKFLL